MHLKYANSLPLKLNLQVLRLNNYRKVELGTLFNQEKFHLKNHTPSLCTLTNLYSIMVRPFEIILCFSSNHQKGEKQALSKHIARKRSEAINSSPMIFQLF